MGNKKIVIGIIALILLVGTGTFVFAGRDGEFDEDSIDYRNDPTYKKVEDDIKGQEVPVIIDNDVNNNDNDNNTENDQDSEEDNSSTTINQGQNNTGSSSTGTSTGNRNPNGGGTNSGTNTGSQNGGSQTGNGTGSNSNTGNNSSDSSSDQTPDNGEEKPIIKDTASPVLKVSYSTQKPTNKEVAVIIEANEAIKPIAGWTLINSKTLKKVFSENTNGEEKVIVYDIAGNSSVAKYNINNIDTIAPEISFTTSNMNGNKLTYKPIEAKITSNEELKEVVGWNLSSDKKTLTKTFAQNILDNLVVYDLAGNPVNVPYEIKNYNKDVPEAVFNRDGNKLTAILTYNEKLDDELGWELNDNGEYEVTLNYENNFDEQILITFPKDGKVVTYESAPVIESVVASNENANGTTNPTNKPVFVTINSNKKLQEKNDWKLEEKEGDYSLIKSYTTVTTINEPVYDLAGNSVMINKNVSNVKVVKTYISSIVVYGNMISIIAGDPIEVPNGWNPKNSPSRTISKTFTKEELEKGINMIITLKDKFGNISQEEIYVKKEQDGSIIKNHNPIIEDNNR